MIYHTFLADFSELTAKLAEGETYNYGQQFVNMLITLCLILVLIFVSIWLLKRLMRSRVHHLNRSTAIRVLEKRMLGQKSALYLVDILGKGVVISESPAGIQKISEFPDDQDLDALLDELQELSSPPKVPLAQRLRKLIVRKT